MTDEWMKQYPSSIVCRNVRGNKEYAKKFRGEADLLLYQLKNAIRFNNLGMLNMKRIFTDGTVITAMSVYGRDRVLIDVSKSVIVAGRVGCTITIISIPTIVQPMRYSGEIHEGEVEGTDYIKTYYSIDISGCPTCDSDVEWGLTATPEESIDNYAWGEVITQGEDGAGKYIIWKAYTEQDTFSRTGLAKLSINGTIRDATDKEICSIFKSVDVDCCEKASGDRIVGMWWEKATGGDPVSYEGKTLYPVPSEITYSDLKEHIIYCIPEVKGSCLPFEWSVVGVGSVEEQELGTRAVYNEPSLPTEFGCANLSLELRDRCEKSVATVNITPCCEDDEYVSPGLNYTSLVMGCNESQSLSATGGCWPFTWSIVSGGGEIVANEGDSRHATYTAPSSNPNCNNNPTIQVQDCCGNSAQIEIAINCTSGIAGYIINWVLSASGNCLESKGCDSGSCLAIYCWSVYKTTFNCDGTLNTPSLETIYLTRNGTAVSSPGSICIAHPTLNPGPDADCDDEFCNIPAGFCWNEGSPTFRWLMGISIPEEMCDGYIADTRTQAQKDAGCCPPQLA